PQQATPGSATRRANAAEESEGSAWSLGHPGRLREESLQLLTSRTVRAAVREQQVATELMHFARPSRRRVDHHCAAARCRQTRNITVTTQHGRRPVGRRLQTDEVAEIAVAQR